ncbi:DUF4388 domain-containing protein [Cylindrospermum sp. FACHB-282]|uniref:DUF4388 domain-containing protein n=1 Tax=Cylindrospermum sp. FACHB-282 TaxID=2692794 RepID=UPI0016887103|nr:DUF4388 domain-containing protein [Cylindrospermum sp. FACHB-282]MBD2388496.1 DUF4388 domain-containing protein [Cylindrospermum sp. FACHB-282]
MAITGNFADFSLPELLQFLDHGKKTGVLQIQFSSEQAENRVKQVYYIWLHQGRIITAADRLDQKGLTSMITQRGWISERVISRVTQISSSAISTPLGLFLKSQGMLQSEQLKLLFNVQVLRPICALFQIQNGQFTFNPLDKLPLPLAEMTGLSMSATEVILMGLRALRDWKALAEKLPDCSSGLTSLVTKQPQMQLNAQEWQVWEFVNGNVSLNNIAHHLRIPVETVQQIGFRLIVVGLVEENFLVAPASKLPLEESITEVLAEPVPEPNQKPTVSQSFLKSLVGFLRSK